MSHGERTFWMIDIKSCGRNEDYLTTHLFPTLSAADPSPLSSPKLIWVSFVFRVRRDLFLPSFALISFHGFARFSPGHRGNNCRGERGEISMAQMMMMILSKAVDVCPAAGNLRPASVQCLIHTQNDACNLRLHKVDQLQTEGYHDGMRHR